MTRCGFVASTLAALLIASAADAGPKASHGHGNWGFFNCPPGLAKKDPPCIPPGQVGKNAVTGDDNSLKWLDIYAVGTSLPDHYVILFDPVQYPMWSHAAYARLGDFLYLINPATGEILSQAGRIGDWTWSWSEVDFANCPPGLAKKNPPCMPPGQAKKAGDVVPDPYQIGDHLPGGYQVIFAPPGTTIPDNALYVRLGNSLYRMDRDTGEVLNLLGSIEELLH